MNNKITNNDVRDFLKRHFRIIGTPLADIKGIKILILDILKYNLDRDQVERALAYHISYTHLYDNTYYALVNIGKN